MSFGKNPKNFSKGRGMKKRTGDRFQKKEWWTVRSPGMFQNRDFTKTPINVTQGKTYSHEQIKGRIFEISVGDLNPGSKNGYQKMRLVVDESLDSTNKICITNFNGLSTTKDHLCFLIRKWHTLIETFVDVKTVDGFLMRFFVIAFTAKTEHQMKATSYAQRSQVKLIRRRMQEVITREVSKISLKELVSKLLQLSIPELIEKECKKIFPLKSCLIRKVKTIKRPRFDIGQLNSMQAEVSQPKQTQAEDKKRDYYCYWNCIRQLTQIKKKRRRVNKTQILRQHLNLNRIFSCLKQLKILT